jgi:circadian clock protein KaiC
MATPEPVNAHPHIPQSAVALPKVETHIDGLDTVLHGGLLHALLAIIGGQAQGLGTRRLALDAVDALTSLLPDPRWERAELSALHHWLRDQQLTTILTMKIAQDSATFAQYAFLDYLVDCVIHLDQRSTLQVSTRRLQVLKYRSSSFHRNEYAYIIAEDGLHLLPVSSVSLIQRSLGETVSSGNGALDALLGGGYKRGTCLLIPGAPGTGKTTLASVVAQSAAARGERVLFLSFEESAEVIVSSMLSPGIDLQPALQAGTLHRTLMVWKARGMAHSPACHEFRITDHGIEMLGVYDSDGSELLGNASVPPHE